MEKTYICAEPEVVTAFKDINGEFHDTRDEAIEASFDAAFRREVNCIVDRTPKLQDTPIGSLQLLVQEFIQINPDMARVIVGDRDAT